MGISMRSKERQLIRRNAPIVRGEQVNRALVTQAQGKTNRLGNSFLMEVPTAESFPTNTLLNPNDQWDLQRNPKRLLSCYSDVDQINSDGSWVVTIKSSLTDVAGASPFLPNLKAILTIGSGGVSYSVVMDAINQVISIPAEDIYLDVAYMNYPNTAPFFLPDQELEVVATAFKSSGQANISPPVMSYPIGQAGVSYQVPVPNSAYAWTYTSYIDPSPSNPLSTCYVFGPGGNILETVDPLVVASMTRMHQFRQLPPGAQFLAITPTAGLPVTGTIEYLLNYG